jgi:hypothetical protein
MKGAEPGGFFPGIGFRKAVPQGLKPSLATPGSARLKSCPDTKHQSRDPGKLVRSVDLSLLSPQGIPSLECILTALSCPSSIQLLYGTTEAVP